MDKFASFKLRFQRNFKKIEQSSKSGAGTSEIYEPTWIHFQRLLFLKEANQTDKSISFIDIENGGYMEFFDNNEPESSHNSPLVPPPKQSSAKRRKLEEDKSQELSNEVMTAALSLIKTKTSQPPKPKEAMGEHEAFCVIVLQKLKKLSDSDGELLMNDIWCDMLKYKANAN